MNKLPLVGLAEIAQRTGRKKPSSITNWRERYDDFPEPVAELAMGPVFWWPDIEAWLRRRGWL